MDKKDLKRFILNFIKTKENESLDKDYIEYSYYELKVKKNLTEEEIDELLRISRDYFQNKDYNVYFTNTEFEYNGQKRKVKSNDYMVAVKNITSKSPTL